MQRFKWTAPHHDTLWFNIGSLDLRTGVSFYVADGLVVTRKGYGVVMAYAYREVCKEDGSVYVFWRMLVQFGF